MAKNNDKRNIPNQSHKYNRSNKHNKQSYARLFFSFWLPMILVVAVLAGVATNLFFYYKAEESEKKFVYDLESVTQRMRNHADNFMEDIQTMRADEIGAWYHNYLATRRFNIALPEAETTIYIENNGRYEEFMTNEDMVFLTSREIATDRFYFFFADPTVMGPEVIDYLNGNNDVDYDVPTEFAQINIEDAYISDGNFIPGKYELVTTSVDKNNEVRTVLIGTYNGATEVPDGYEHIVFDNQDWSLNTAVMSFTWENRQSHFPKEDTIERLNEEANMSGMKYSNPFGVIACWHKMETRIVVPKDSSTNSINSVDSFEIMEAQVVSVMEINIWEEYRGMLITAYIAAGLLVTLIAAAIAFYYYRLICDKIKQEQYRKDMTNALAHDLKSPLMVISGYAENLKENVHAEKKDYYAASILETVRYMNDMIGNILELSKLEDLTIALQKEPVSLSEQTQILMARYESMMQQKGLHCEMKGESTISADLSLMQRVLDNLISNAIQYTQKDGQIVIEMGTDFYRISNTGNIDYEMISHLTEPLVKGKKERSGESGIGLGLTIVKNILDLHHFRYTMENKGDSVCFEMLFTEK